MKKLYGGKSGKNGDDQFNRFNYDEIPYALHPDNLPERPELKTIFIVEGEETANLLNDVLRLAEKITAVAVTLQNGSNRVELLEGFLQRYPDIAKKRIRILPNNDEPGMELTMKVTIAVFNVNSKANVKIVQLSGLPKDGNFADWYGKYKNENMSMDDKELAMLVMKGIVEYSKQTEAITPEVIESW